MYKDDEVEGGGEIDVESEGERVGSELEREESEAEREESGTTHLHARFGPFVVQSLYWPSQAFTSFGNVARLNSRVVIHNILGFIPLIDQEMAIFHIIKPYWEIRLEVMVCIRLKLQP